MRLNASEPADSIMTAPILCAPRPLARIFYIAVKKRPGFRLRPVMWVCGA